MTDQDQGGIMAAATLAGQDKCTKLFAVTAAIIARSLFPLQAISQFTAATVLVKTAPAVSPAALEVHSRTTAN